MASVKDKSGDKSGEKSGGKADDKSGKGAAPGSQGPDFIDRMVDVSAQAQDMMLNFWKDAPQNLKLSGILPEAGGLVKQASNFWETLARTWAAADPMQLMELQKQWMTDALTLWTNFATGHGPADKIKDRRFKSEVWEDVPVFDLIRRSYLLASDYLTRSLDAFPGLNDEDRERLRFQAKQFVDAMSPSNFASLNPEVLAEARTTNGQSLLDGLQHLLTDLKRGQLTMTDESAFELGENIAATPGKVVFENHMFQLIQYTPTTKEVYETPIVYFPAWINKYYILDLTAEKSMVRWMVEQGFTVFIVSWKMPGEEHRNVTMDTYIQDGMETAIDTVCKIANVKSTHTVGYCVAGTTLAAALAYFTATGEVKAVKTATFFTAQVDFTEAGDLLNYINPGMLKTLEKMGAERGYVDGRWLALSFNLLRPNDLMWTYVVNNYLKGRDYKPFDLLYWNSDSVNVPANWHQKYLKDLYQNNLLVQPGGVTVGGVPIDLKTVKVPLYLQAGREDHIAPAVSCFKLTKTFGGPFRFVLAGSGHIAGVINPPDAEKYQHWILPEGVAFPDTLDGFLAKAKEVPGSWWPDWRDWLIPQSGTKVPARQPGSKDFPPIEDAPGRYVRERITPKATLADESKPSAA